MAVLFEFDPFDHPTQLSKIGNWVITFLSPADEQQDIQLAITYVLPRQANDQLQARRIIINSTANEQRWLIEKIECFDSAQNTELDLLSTTPEAQQVLDTVIQEFARYDVQLQLINE
ncbi:hypothetical protein D7V64_12890 [Acinetobacter cumulans]|uniref:Uncharacterized protein n=1 Tax=Acinetobacter cumulans TaxID=2136182 RepID=A0A3A8FVK1_9GAMM|nr:hypothetical protein [Acinetobacter cumulans]RKG50199.1 hypothetical protein D7V64_12890 [Acinetobacter cumulans]